MLVASLLSVVRDSQHAEATSLIHVPTPRSSAKSPISRRQVIAVTHNPNLAIVGDADQLIVATYVDGTFCYASGSLAQHDIGAQSINVLEGTWEAFDNRERKYHRVVGRATGWPSTGAAGA